MIDLLCTLLTEVLGPSDVQMCHLEESQLGCPSGFSALSLAGAQGHQAVKD